MMNHSILRQIIRRAQTGKFYSVIADETTDSSRKQQLSESISPSLLDTLPRLGLDKHPLRGQCYDGASVMSGNSAAGVAKRTRRRSDSASR